MKNKILIVLLVVVLLISCSACAKKDDKTPTKEDVTLPFVPGVGPNGQKVDDDNPKVETTPSDTEAQTPNETINKTVNGTIKDISIVGHQTDNNGNIKYLLIKYLDSSSDKYESTEYFAFNGNAENLLILSGYEKFIQIDVDYKKDKSSQEITSYTAFVRGSNTDVSNVKDESELRTAIGFYSDGMHEEVFEFLRVDPIFETDKIATVPLVFKDADGRELTIITYHRGSNNYDIEIPNVDNKDLWNQTSNEFLMKSFSGSEIAHLIKGNSYTVSFAAKELGDKNVELTFIEASIIETPFAIENINPSEIIEQDRMLLIHDETFIANESTRTCLLSLGKFNDLILISISGSTTGNNKNITSYNVKIKETDEDITELVSLQDEELIKQKTGFYDEGVYAEYLKFTDTVQDEDGIKIECKNKNDKSVMISIADNFQVEETGLAIQNGENIIHLEKDKTYRFSFEVKNENNKYVYKLIEVTEENNGG